MHCRKLTSLTVFNKLQNGFRGFMPPDALIQPRLFIPFLMQLTIVSERDALKYKCN